MDYSNLLDYILHLRQKSDSHKLIIFVGAGVSKNVPGMLDWQELIQKMADAINYSRCYNCRRQTKNCEKNCNFKNAYSTDEYLKMNLCSKLISSISFDSLSESEKVAFLFNKALHECSPGYPFDRKAIMAYIDNMSSKRVQDMYGIYKTIIGNIYPVSHSIDNSLEKLKDYYGPNCHFVGISSLTELYKIKFHAYNFYNFYFRNHVCFSNLYEYQAIIAPYIEAIMITNGESIEQPHDKSLFGFSTSRKLRYPLEIIDFDILTKSILPKELSRLLQHYNVKSLETSQALLNTVLNSFHNLAESMLSFSSFRRGHIVKAFLNYCLLLPKLPLSPTNKSQLSLYLTDILMNENFVSEFFSIYFYEWKSSLKISCIAIFCCCFKIFKYTIY